jgi:two-component system sensor histidine kinase/response regulator
MNSRAKYAASALIAWFLRWLPRGLESQILVLTSACLVLSILGYGYFRALEEIDNARRSISAQMIGLAKNLAAVDAHFIETGESAKIEALTLHTATVDGIYSVLVTDTQGHPLSEVVNKNGTWSPRYNVTPVEVPHAHNPESVFTIEPDNPARRDFLAGNGGTMTAWHRIDGSKHSLGWVRVNYRLDTFDAIASGIWWQAAKAVGIATLITLLLLSWLLRPSMRALREATRFAGKLDTALGAQLRVSRRATEIEDLGHALNVVSDRLLAQHTELSNQKFALDQHAIVSITDLNGDITYANQRFCDISGYTVDELLGNNHRLVKSDEHPTAFFDELWRTITQGKVWNGDVKNRKKDGGFYWVSATIVPLLDSNGLPHHYIGIRTDITVNKELERRLLHARDQAEAATVAKGQFLANMSHEIRTPMNAILGMLKLLQNTELSRRQLDYASKAEGAAQSLLGLLNDILDFSKIDAGKMTLETRAFRLDKLLRNLSVIVSTNVGVKPVEVLFDIDPTTPKALMGDALRLQQVLINLSGNAVKFTSQGEVVISIAVVQRTATDAMLRFAVRDSGIGIAPENQGHIFDGFSQAEASTTRRFGGTGLGLSISKRLVGLMGGQLELQSTLGQGSTFSFAVTLALAPETEQDREATPATNLRVLVVDDNPTAREILAAMVESLGWQVDLACDGVQALTLMRTHSAPGQMPYQAVFVDWQMPGMDGWETIASMEHVNPGSPTPIVVMVTANGRDMLSQRGADDLARLHAFLVKPVTASMLHDAVADALASRKQTPGSDPAAPETKIRQLQGLRLLVVEDNVINQQVAQEMLSTEGAIVELADNGQLGVQAVQQAITDGKPFDAVLMDLQMPVMDGFGATNVLRQEMRLTHLPIIAMTANAMASDRDACLAAGMNAHVGKPFHLDQLVALLHSLTQPASQSRPTRPPVETRPTAAPPSEPALPSIDTVDQAGALERLGNNHALYARVLQSYLDSLAGQPDQLEAALRHADWTGAGRLLHTLKGLSATVGASYMAAVARRAELAVMGAQAPDAAIVSPDVPALCASLRAAVLATQSVLGQVAQSYRQHLPVAAPAAVAWGVTGSETTALAASHPTGPDRALVLELRALLLASDMQAIAALEQLRQHPATADTASFRRLAHLVDELDFAQAAQLCTSLLQLESDQ